MRYETKILSDKFSDIFDTMVQDDWDLVLYEQGYSFWKKKITQKRKQNTKLEDTILYEKNNPYKIVPHLKDKEYLDKYKEFRQARYEKHKDIVTPLGEKKLLNILAKHPKSIGIALMDYSMTYKSIVEDLNTIEAGRVEIQKKQLADEEHRKRLEEQKHSKSIKEHKENIDQKILKSGKSKSYWIEQAKEELKKKFPTMKEEYMLPMIPSQLNKLLLNK